MVGKENMPEKNQTNNQAITELDDYFNARVGEVVKLNHVFVVCSILPRFNWKRSNRNRVNLLILVDSGTTQKDIKDDWQQIIKIRDKVDAYNGVVKVRQLSVSQTAYRLKYEFDMKYVEIANFFNFEIIVVLSQALGLVNEPTETEYDEIMKEFDSYFVSLGYSLDEAKEYAEYAKEEIENGRFPWRFEAGPFTAGNVREQVREFKEKVNDSSISLNKTHDYIFGYIGNSQDRDKMYSLYKITYRINNTDQKLVKKFFKVYSLIVKNIMKTDVMKLLIEMPEVGKLNSFFP